MRMINQSIDSVITTTDDDNKVEDKVNDVKESSGAVEWGREKEAPEDEKAKEETKWSGNEDLHG